MIRLNLGCGGKLLDGFINVDFPSNWSKKRPDVECDIRSLPFPDGHADEVHAYHVIEHFYRWETVAVLKEWARVLKPDGAMVIECPCLDKILARFAEGASPRLTILGLYGDPAYKNEAMTHKWCFSRKDMRDALQAAGLVAAEEEPLTHIAARDMRWICAKAA